ncbi:hypothetical protein NLU13_3192 [Sarocladium strictum]|uniref:Golgi apparatus membrane protein TVP38 n=1 Tax=Sarocladium strictum TaxID=5046 RepID=A0AA39GLL4_SARSR|nr:hypothetical protein NLU13_3192 [Sarocladium strictum]
MPADYQSTAEALAVSPSRSDSPPSQAPWSNPSSRGASRRLSRLPSRTSSYRGARRSPRAQLRRFLAAAQETSSRASDAFWAMPLQYRVLAVAGCALGWVLLILFIVYSGRLFEWFTGVATTWRDIPGGWIIMMLVVAATAFPPMIGYSTATTIAGFVFGFPGGWPIAAAGATFGSLGAFLAARTVLSGYVERMVGHDKRFIALGQVLRRDGIWYLTGIRFCPLPFSLSNGFLATIPTITPLAFFISTSISMPKLFIHIFIGSRLAAIAEDEKMSFRDKLVNWTGMLVGGLVGFGIGYIIYRRTMARAAELAREDEQANGGAAEQGHGGGFYDSEPTMMDPEDAAELLDDDDVSLWDTQVDDEYCDEDDAGKPSQQQ